MVNQDLGRVSVVARGAYDPSAVYERLDVVSYNGSSYLVRKHCRGVEPAEGEYYMLLAHAGDSTVIEQGINQLKSELTDISDAENLFSIDTITSDKRLDSMGQEMVDKGFYTSDFIGVIEGFSYKKNSPTEDNHHRVAFYNQNFEFNGCVTHNAFTITSGTKYIRFCGLSAEATNATVTLCSAKDIKARNNDETQKLNKIIPKKNLFNKNAPDKTIGKYFADKAGVPDISPNDAYCISGFIEVEASTPYTYRSRSGGSYNCWFDENFVFLSKFQNSSVSGVTVTSPSNAKYIRVSYGVAEINETQLERGSTATEYEEYTLIDCEDEIRKGNIKTTNNRIESIFGKNGLILTDDSMASGDTLTTNDFPFYVKKNVGITFYAKFDSFTSITVGKGYNAYRGDWFEINTTNVVRHHYESSDTTTEKAHGLTISEYIMGNIYLDKDGNLNISINTTGGTYTTSFESDYNVFSGAIFLKSGGSMTNVKLSASLEDVRKPLWILGDSYMGLNADRVFGQLKTLGYWNGYLADGLAGGTTQQAYAEINKLLAYGVPKYIILYTGMNDATLSAYQNYVDLLKTICTEKGITLILNKVPTVPERDKSEIASYVVDSGLRYIDSVAAVGANSSGVWYTGYLNQTDKVHPTELGAKALAMRMVVDVPEIMLYGYYGEESVSGTTSGDR